MQMPRCNRGQRMVMIAGSILFVGMWLYPPWVEIHKYLRTRYVPPFGDPQTIWDGYSRSIGYSWIGAPPGERSENEIRGSVTHGAITRYTNIPEMVEYAVDWHQLGVQWSVLIAVVVILLVALGIFPPRDRTLRVKDSPTPPKLLSDT